MKVVLQRVSSANVSVAGSLHSAISRGLVAFVGISKDDSRDDVERIANKIINIKTFESDEGAMWKRSVKDIQGDVLCISQFTLYGNTSKGNKPDFHNAMNSAPAKDMYAALLQHLRSMYAPDKIKDGIFGEMMSVSLSNEGPVTLNLDSKR